MFRENLNKIVHRKNLSGNEMSEMITEIFSGSITDAQIGAFMAALATKGETFEELAGAAKAMRRKALRIQVSSPTVVDTCGTGGDAAQTFNISTTEEIGDVRSECAWLVLQLFNINNRFSHLINIISHVGLFSR